MKNNWFEFHFSRIPSKKVRNSITHLTIFSVQQKKHLQVFPFFSCFNISIIICMYVWSDIQVNYKNLMKFMKTLQAIWKHFWTKMDLDPVAKRGMMKLQWPRIILKELFITWFICLYGAGKYTSIVQFFLNMFAAQLCTRSPIPSNLLKITKRLIEIFRLYDLNLKCVYFLSKCPLCIILINCE